MSVVRTIAWRFMLKGTERGRFSPMTLFTWLAIGVGVGTMCSLLSVMYGLESSLRDKVLKAYPHVMIQLGPKTPWVRGHEKWTQRFAKMPGVVRVTPVLETEMIAQSEESTLGAVIWGIPDEDLLRIQPDVRFGGLPKKDARLSQVVLGEELARHLDSEVGGSLTLISPLKRSGAMGLVPQTFPFEVSGFYRSGHYDFDKQYLFMRLEDAQELVQQRGVVSGWHVWAEDMDGADAVAAAISAKLPDGWRAQSWSQFNAALFQSLQLEQLSMFLILSFAVLIAVMNVAITLMMHVAHKKRNIGVLRALGASKAQVRSIFLWQGGLIGLVGLVLGAVLAVAAIAYVQAVYQFPDIYYERAAPIEVRPLSIAIVYIVAIALIFLATLYPAAKAARLNPIEAIRE